MEVDSVVLVVVVVVVVVVLSAVVAVVVVVVVVVENTSGRTQTLLPGACEHFSTLMLLRKMQVPGSWFSMMTMPSQSSFSLHFRMHSTGRSDGAKGSGWPEAAHRETGNLSLDMIEPLASCPQRQLSEAPTHQGHG